MTTSLVRALLVASAFAIAACSSDSAPQDTADSGTWGSVHCTNSSNTTNAQGGCSRGYSGCSDGHSYGIECAATCTCRIDTTATGHSVNANCGGDGLAGLAENCGWMVH